SLARDAYAHTDPVALLDTHTHPTPAALLRHLLTQALVIAYPNPAERDHATRWLTWIAQHMDTDRDLRWWDIPTWMAGSPGAVNLAAGLVGGLVGGLMGGIVFGLARWLVYGFVYGFVYGLTMGLTMGLVFGLVFGLVGGLTGGIGIRRSQPQAFSVRRP